MGVSGKATTSWVYVVCAISEQPLKSSGLAQASVNKTFMAYFVLWTYGLSYVVLREALRHPTAVFPWIFAIYAALRAVFPWIYDRRKTGRVRYADGREAQRPELYADLRYPKSDIEGRYPELSGIRR
jgi:hypothetical protein